MPLDPSIFQQLDTKLPEKIANILDPANIQERKMKLSDLANERKIKGLHLQNLQTETDRAPIMNARADTQYGQQQADYANKQIATHIQNAKQMVISDKGSNESLTAAYKYILSNGAPKERADEMLRALAERTPVEREQWAGKSMMTPEKLAERTVPELTKPEKVQNWQNPEYQKYEQDKAKFEAGLKPKEDKTLVAVIGPDGQTPVLVPRAQAAGMTPIASKAASKPTEQEAKAAFYAKNMKAASATLDALEAAGFDLTKVSSQAGTALAGGFTNILASKEAQQAKQAQNQWAEQMLRMQTGAAAPPPEIERTVKTYFPTVGDERATVDLKRSMRLQAEGGVFEAAGRAKDRIPSQSSNVVDFGSLK